MDKQLILSSRFKYLTIAMMAVGLIVMLIGLILNPTKTWANLLVNNYYFLTLGIGAFIFLAFEYLTHSGWSSGFLRVPMAMGNIIPVIFILMLVALFGMHHLWEWTLPDATLDPLIKHKFPYLNIPFFVIRIFIYFAVWILLTQLLRRYSLKEDEADGSEYYSKSVYYSKVYIFSLAVTFSFASFDWIMSVDVRWFSTIFAIRNFTMAYYHATAVIALIVIILNKYGYFPFLNKNHLQDLSRFIFALGIIWAYMWFVQYLLMWYANIPEETIYYRPRVKGDFKPLFYLEMIVNWAIPFFVLMTNMIARNKTVLVIICIVLIFGQWIDVYLQVIVGTYHKLSIGFIEIGMFIGFVGLFAYVVAESLARMPLIPKHHPLLEESLEHN